MATNSDPGRGGQRSPLLNRSIDSEERKSQYEVTYMDASSYILNNDSQGILSSGDISVFQNASGLQGSSNGLSLKDELTLNKTWIVVDLIVITAILAVMGVFHQKTIDILRVWLLAQGIYRVIEIGYLLLFRMIYLKEHTQETYLHATPPQSLRVGKSVLLVIYGSIIIYGSIGYFSRSDASNAPYEMRVLTLLLLVMGYLYLGIPVLGIVLILCCLPCLYVYAWYRHRSDPNGPRPASKAAIKKLTKVLYEPEKNTLFTDIDNTCAICLSDYELKDKLLQLKCFHHFHKDCAENWLKKNGICPTCRTPILPKRDDSINNSQDMGDTQPNRS